MSCISRIKNKTCALPLSWTPCHFSSVRTYCQHTSSGTDWCGPDRLTWLSIGLVARVHMSLASQQVQDVLLCACTEKDRIMMVECHWVWLHDTSQHTLQAHFTCTSNCFLMFLPSETGRNVFAMWPLLSCCVLWITSGITLVWLVHLWLTLTFSSGCSCRKESALAAFTSRYLQQIFFSFLFFFFPHTLSSAPSLL